MLSLEEAKRVIFEAVASPEAETISVRNCLGRVLAQELALPGNLPETRRSAMDGYAVRFGRGLEFKQVGVVVPARRVAVGVQVGDVSGSAVHACSAASHALQGCA